MNFEAFTGAVEAFVGVNWFTMLAAWCNLLILYLFLKKLLFKPLKNMIDSRQKEIDDMYADAEGSRTEAAELKLEYEARLENANNESEEILKSAMRRAKLREEEILKEANEKAARTVERAYEQVELEKKRAINEVKNEVSEMAVGIAAALIERDVSGDDVEVRFAEIPLATLAKLGLGAYDDATGTLEADFTVTGKTYAFRCQADTVGGLPMFFNWRVFELTGLRFDNFATKGNGLSVCEVIMTGVFKRPMFAAAAPYAIRQPKEDGSDLAACSAWLAAAETLPKA